MILIIADDLTGAADSAAQFWPGGRPIRVITEARASHFSWPDPCQVVAINAQTRECSAGQAAQVWRRLGRDLWPLYGGGDGGDVILVKKIDTAFRGNVGVEIEQLLRLGKTRQ